VENFPDTFGPPPSSGLDVKYRSSKANNGMSERFKSTTVKKEVSAILQMMSAGVGSRKT